MLWVKDSIKKISVGTQGGNYFYAAEGLSLTMNRTKPLNLPHTECGGLGSRRGGFFITNCIDKM